MATIGEDTVQVDQIRFRDGRIEGTIVLRVGRTSRTEYVAELGADGALTRFEAAGGAVGDSVPGRRLVAEFGPDSIRGAFEFRGDARDFVLPVDGDPVPFASLYGAFHYDRALRRVLVADTVTALAGLHNGGIVSMGTERIGERGVRLEVGPFGSVVVEAGEDGHAERIDATGTTIKMVYQRTGHLDVDSLATAYARLDAEGRGLGTLSPADEVAARVGGAEIRIEYSRPRTRGRVIFGDVVPFGEVWRTGANAATLFTTSHDVELGGVRVPAGGYSLWTVPGRDRWTLVLNSQTGQWGTVYDPERDFARIPMAVQELTDTVEAFTIRIDTIADGGRLRLRWDRTEASVTVRPVSGGRRLP